MYSEKNKKYASWLFGYILFYLQSFVINIIHHFCLKSNHIDTLNNSLIRGDRWKEGEMIGFVKKRNFLWDQLSPAAPHTCPECSTACLSTAVGYTCHSFLTGSRRCQVIRAAHAWSLKKKMLPWSVRQRKVLQQDISLVMQLRDSTWSKVFVLQKWSILPEYKETEHPII